MWTHHANNVSRRLVAPGVAVKARSVLLWMLAAALLSATQAAWADGPWEGFWEAYSSGEDAYVSLRQDSDRVVGTYFPYNGHLEGVAKDGVLRGTWRSPNGEGTFVFSLTPDGQAFSGSIGSGEWWNGRRIDEEDVGTLDIDLRDAGRTVRSFMAAGRAYRQGEISGLQAMFSALYFAGDPPFAEKSRRARLLYDVLTQTTFRIFEIRPARETEPGQSEPGFTYQFEQAGTGEAVTLRFQRDVFDLWRIEAPEAAQLEAQLARLLAARGRKEIDPTAYLALASPRQTLEAFIVGMARWDVDGTELVSRTFDLSAVSEKLRDSRLPVLATFMAGVLNHIGHLTLEELPDDPARGRPYLLYQHPVGNIVLARTVDADGQPRWQFTAETLDGIKALHDAVRTVPVSFENVRNPHIDTPYLWWRSRANDLSPTLTIELAGIELWQWLGVVVLALVLPFVLHLGLRRIERARAGRMLLSRLVAVGVPWVISATALGLPDRLSGPLYAVGWVLLIVAITWLLYRAVTAANSVLARLAKRTESTADDVAVTLLTGLARILLVVGALIAIADVLGMPYQTVLAGVGVSGLALAIASRDLLANLFGSVIIASDRPFTRGDFVSVGNIMGTVEQVGLRSTRLRPVDDTSVTIPNSTIATDRVVNLSKRRKIRVLETIHVSHDASVEAILALRERLRGELLADPMVADENVRVGLATISLYAVEMEISFYISTADYDAFLYEKHRIMAHLLSTLEAAGVERAVIRRD